LYAIYTITLRLYVKVVQIFAGNYCRLLVISVTITEGYWRLLKITGDYWKILEIKGGTFWCINVTSLGFGLILNVQFVGEKSQTQHPMVELALTPLLGLYPRLH